MPPMLRYTTDIEVSIPSVIVPDPDANDMFKYALSQVLLGQNVTVEINAENGMFARIRCNLKSSLMRRIPLLN